MFEAYTRSLMTNQGRGNCHFYAAVVWVERTLSIMKLSLSSWVAAVRYDWGSIHSWKQRQKGMQDVVSFSEEKQQVI